MTTTWSDRQCDKNDICRFFTRYASYMLGCGATCQRIGINLQRMAKVADSTVDLIILPSHIMITLVDNQTGQACHHSETIAKVPISYEINTLLSKLSWKIAEGDISFPSAVDMLERVVTTARSLNPWGVMFMVVLANAAFCRLFGGDIHAMAIVAGATLVGYGFKNILLSCHIDVKVVFLLCSFISAIIGSAGYIFHVTPTPEVALGTSVLYLIPGIPYINSITDMMTNHYLCACSRFMNALLLTGCIAIGLTAAFLVMNIKIF